MNGLLETMYLKRFCLPSNLDVKNNTYINKINDCLCGDSNHIACVFQGKIGYLKNKLNILSFGIINIMILIAENQVYMLSIMQ
jgi:hypothetical protein